MPRPTAMQTYDELRIRYHSVGGGRYLAWANGSSTAAAVIRPRRKLEDVLADITALYDAEFRRVTDGSSPDDRWKRLRELGRELYEDWIPLELGKCIQEARESAPHPARALRLRFGLEAELSDLPVEILWRPADEFPLVRHEDLAIVRSLPVGDLPAGGMRFPQRRAHSPVVRLLVIAASPRGKGSLDIDGELARLKEHLPAAPGREPFDVLSSRPGAPVTLDRAKGFLQSKGARASAILLIAHGERDPVNGNAILYLETKNGAPEVVDGGMLSDLLLAATGARLVVLNLCSSAKVDAGDRYGGLAHGLIRAGFPAVIGMNWDVGDRAAKHFSSAFLGKLCSPVMMPYPPIELEVSRARREMSLTTTTRLEWATPALFLHDQFSGGRAFFRDAQDEPKVASLDEFQRLTDSHQAIPPDLYVACAEECRALRNWADMRSFASSAKLVDGLEDRQQRRVGDLEAEANRELAASELRLLCQRLCDPNGADAAAIDRACADLLPRVSRKIATILSDAVQEWHELLSLSREADAATNAEDWKRVEELCEEILRRRPEGFREARSQQARARRELEAIGIRAERRAQFRQADLTWRQGSWKTGLSLLEKLPNDFEGVADLRRKWSDTLGQLTRARLAGDPRAGEQGSNPYEHVRAVDIHPASSRQQVLEGLSAQMMRGAMPPQVRSAHDQLRRLEERLVVDAWLYGAEPPDPVRARGVHDGSDGGLDASAPVEDPLFFVLSGQRQAAIAEWERRLRKDPGDCSTLHHLAIACYWDAEDLEARNDARGADAAWSRALALWARLLLEDDYWKRWASERAECYGERVTEAHMADARLRLARQLSGALLACAERQREVGRADRESACRRMALTFEAECAAAAALRSAGGLCIPAETAVRIHCGPLYAVQGDLQSPLAQRIRELESDSYGDAAAAGAEPTASRALYALGGEDRGRDQSRLRRSFSMELGAAQVALDQFKPELALSVLAPFIGRRVASVAKGCTHGEAERLDPAVADACEECGHFLHRTPGYLLLANRRVRELQDAVDLVVQAHLAKTQEALERAREGRTLALESIDAALAAAKDAGQSVRAKQAVAELVLGRAEALCHERGERRGERLSEAIDLLLEVEPRVLGGGDDRLRAKAAEALSFRGVWWGYLCHEWREPDYDLASADLRRALKMNPRSLHARDNLARALVFNATNLPPEETHRGLELILEALRALDEGLRETEGHRQLRGVLLTAVDELEEIVMRDLTTEELRDRLDAGPPTAVAGESNAARAGRLIERARAALATSNHMMALTSVIEAVRMFPEDSRARALLLEAVAVRAASLASHGGRAHP